ncbi:TPA: hypothetical protein DIC40_08100 [Patescibacteria group bacterium]|nr:hypothetical protein [Candidatus Gracilibacteria bacterium]
MRIINYLSVSFFNYIYFFSLFFFSFFYFALYFFFSFLNNISYLIHHIIHTNSFVKICTRFISFIFLFCKR